VKSILKPLGLICGLAKETERQKEIEKSYDKKNSAGFSV
jgi:hypothetical protein